MSEKPSRITLESQSDVAVPSTSTDKAFPEGGTRAWLTLLGAQVTAICFENFDSIMRFQCVDPVFDLRVYKCLRSLSRVCTSVLQFHSGDSTWIYVALPFSSTRLYFSQFIVDYYIREYLTNYSPSTIGWIGGVQICLIFAAGIFTGRAFDRGYLYVLLSLHRLGIVSHYFQHYRPLAMGLVAAGSALGAVLHPIMLNRLFHGSVGFHNGVRISAAMNATLLIIANALMRTRLPPHKTGAAIPLRKFLHDSAYLFCLDAVSHGVDSQLAFYCISVLNAASFFGRFIPPIFVPKLGVFNLIIIFTLCMSASLYSLGAIHTTGGFFVFAILYGFFSGGGISLTPPMLASLANDTSEIGARIGVAYAVSGIAGLVVSFGH
ncbi:hypothetical protein H0H92_002777 [Tricholoma furcatifolium]|nr:hypothetical protein H0H92_002777 [Tricholoma furcatifolium]